MMYIRFPLSLRDVVDLLHERGIDICHETVRFWWHRFGPMFAAEIRKRRIEGMKSSRWPAKINSVGSGRRWRLPVTPNDRCWTPPAAAPLIAMLLLTDCAMGNSKRTGRVCPPVVEYGQPVLDRATKEVEELHEGTVLSGKLSDYAVMRDQVRVCRGKLATNFRKSKMTASDNIYVDPRPIAVDLPSDERAGGRA